MRFVSVIFSALLLVSGSAFAQEVALTQGKPDCPPGEPDSLQISWTQPCDAGSCLLDTETGCRMWDWHPEPEDTVIWKGRCLAHRPDGHGEAQWFEHGRPIDRFVGTYRNGKREGEGHYVWNETVRFDGNYADDVPQGYGVAQIEGETLAGEWSKGCISSGGKVAAIGVPRSSCGAKQPEKVVVR